jgi:hypothetical protein
VASSVAAIAATPSTAITLGPTNPAFFAGEEPEFKGH